MYIVVYNKQLMEENLFFYKDQMNKLYFKTLYKKDRYTK